MRLSLFGIICLILINLGFAQMQVYTLEEGQVDQTTVVIKNDFWENSQWTWRLDPEAQPRTDGWERHRDLGQTFIPKENFILDKINVEISNGSNRVATLTTCQNRPIHLDILLFDLNITPPNSKTPPVDTISSQSGRLPAVLDSAQIANYGLGYLLVFDIVDVPLEAGKFYGFLLKFDSLLTKQTINIEKNHGQYPDGTMLLVYFDGSNGRENVKEWQWSHCGHGDNPERDLRFYLQKATGSSIAGTVSHQPTSVSLAQNYPNPFNPVTTIQFNLPVSGFVSLKIFQSDGKLVKTLIHHLLNTGEHKVQWDGTDGSDKPVASGLYFYQLISNQQTLIRKMTLLK